MLSNAPGAETWSGPGVSPNGIFNPQAAGLGSHTITYQTGMAGFGSNCIKTASITVNIVNATGPIAQLTTSGPTTFCAGKFVTLIGSGGTNYLWQPGNFITPSITVNESGIYKLLVSNSLGCQDSIKQLVTVNPVPNTVAGPDSSITQNSNNITLIGFPIGGIWSGTGVTNGLFNASQPLGSYALSYCFTNNLGCTKCDTMVISIEPLNGNAYPIFANNLQIHPNPTSDFINLAFSRPIENAILEFFNSLGQSVKKLNFDKLERRNISLKSLPVGIYNLRISSRYYNSETRLLRK
jgi:hypothetical protein